MNHPELTQSTAKSRNEVSVKKVVEKKKDDANDVTTTAAAEKT